MRLGSTSVKAMRKMLVKLTPGCTTIGRTRTTSDSFVIRIWMVVRTVDD